MKLELSADLRTILRDEGISMKGFHKWRFDQIRRLDDQDELEPGSPLKNILEAQDQFDRAIEVMTKPKPKDE